MKRAGDMMTVKSPNKQMKVLNIPKYAVKPNPSSLYGFSGVRSSVSFPSITGL